MLIECAHVTLWDRRRRRRQRVGGFATWRRRRKCFAVAAAAAGAARAVACLWRYRFSADGNVDWVQTPRTGFQRLAQPTRIIVNRITDIRQPASLLVCNAQTKQPMREFFGRNYGWRSSLHCVLKSVYRFVFGIKIIRPKSADFVNLWYTASTWNAVAYHLHTEVTLSRKVWKSRFCFSPKYSTAVLIKQLVLLLLATALFQSPLHASGLEVSAKVLYAYIRSRPQNLPRSMISLPPESVSFVLPILSIPVLSTFTYSGA